MLSNDSNHLAIVTVDSNDVHCAQVELPPLIQAIALASFEARQHAQQPHP